MGEAGPSTAEKEQQQSRREEGKEDKEVSASRLGGEPGAARSSGARAAKRSGAPRCVLGRRNPAPPPSPSPSDLGRRSAHGAST
jgi:hypothetical protein